MKRHRSDISHHQEIKHDEPTITFNVVQLCSTSSDSDANGELDHGEETPTNGENDSNALSVTGSSRSAKVKTTTVTGIVRLGQSKLGHRLYFMDWAYSPSSDPLMRKSYLLRKG
ncbi:hypothetical protein VKT23_006608 [Stygiomarasmius scandens]|uniref:Uncharacterized protein n=1 Tax=Marasmiellus scandens TaxID=2682957 RepID=A0ABR1JP36_9AGAR